MKNKEPDPQLIDDENPEWTAEDMKRAPPAPEVLTELFGEKATQELLRRSRRGRPAKDEQERKVNQTLRIDPDVLEAYKQEGKGWQTRINQVLRDKHATAPEIGRNLFLKHDPRDPLQ